MMGNYSLELGAIVVSILIVLLIVAIVFGKLFNKGVATTSFSVPGLVLANTLLLQQHGILTFSRVFCKSSNTCILSY